MKVSFKTLGCRLNQHETDALVSSFDREGFEIVDFKDQNDVNENIVQIGRLRILDFLEEFKKYIKEDSPLVTLPDSYIEFLTKELEYIEDFNINTAVFNEHLHNMFFEVFGDKYFEVYPEIENSFIEIYELAERSCVLKWIKENT